MKWRYCNYCPLDGTCENQDRGHECEMPVKKLLEENEQLIKFLEEFNALDVAKENQQLKELLKECREEFVRLNIGGAYWAGDFDKILEKLDSAIGEKK